MYRNFILTSNCIFVCNFSETKNLPFYFQSNDECNHNCLDFWPYQPKDHHFGNEDEDQVSSETGGSKLNSPILPDYSGEGDTVVQNSGLNDTFTVSSVDSSFDRLSVSDISSKSTDSLLILTPVSSEVINRPDLPLFERQNNFRGEVRPSLSELSVNQNLELENKFSSTSIETVIEGERPRPKREFEEGYPLERKDSSQLNFGLIDIIVKSSISKMMPHFLKYIPTDVRKNTLVPICLHNEVHQSEWWELQNSLNRHTFGTAPHATSSETTVQERKRSSRKTSKKRLKRLFMCTAAQDSPMKPRKIEELPLHNEETCFKSAETADSLTQPESELPALDSNRFNPESNERHIKISCKKDVLFTATLYTPIPEDPNYNLCHFQADMALTAMMAFFHPWSEIQCVLGSEFALEIWPNSCTKVSRCAPKFARSVRMCEFKAILVVCEDAACLFRHRGIGFLSSVAAALSIEAKHLLVLVREGSTCLDKTVKV